jgi:hypothetical protein
MYLTRCVQHDKHECPAWGNVLDRLEPLPYSLEDFLSSASVFWGA